MRDIFRKVTKILRQTDRMTISHRLTGDIHVDGQLNMIDGIVRLYVEPASIPPLTYFHNQKMHWYCPDNAKPHNHLDEPAPHLIHELQTWHSKYHRHHDTHVNQSELHLNKVNLESRQPISSLYLINLSVR